jgi:hypothetical protein
MSSLSGKPSGNLSGSAEAAESGAYLLARARLMMMISALTTALAIAAVVAVVGYRFYTAGSSVVGIDGIVALPKGARVVSAAASGGRVAVLVDVNGESELRVFDIKTLKQTGSIRFSTAP